MNHERIKKAHNILDQLLKEYRCSSGGWAPFTDEDQLLFYQLLDAISEAKFEPDPDGDTPLEYQLVNRTKYEKSPFFLIPYSHDKNVQLSTLLTCVQNAQINVDIAASQLRRATEALTHYLSDKNTG